VPGNATIAIVGDFDMAQAKELVTRYFARVPASTRPISRDYPREKPSKAERRVVVRENWPLPAVIVAYPITFDGHPDSYPLHLTSKILSDGDSSRIYRSLVYEKEIALSAFGGGNIIEEPNLFYAVGLVAPGHTPDEVEKALIAEFDKLREQPITERELQRAKNQFFRDYIIDRESIRGKASQLAHAVVIHDDVTTADGEVEIFTNMTVGDLHRVAKTYFTPESRMVLTVLPKAPGAR
jgi:zinc protease